MVGTQSPDRRPRCVAPWDCSRPLSLAGLKHDHRRDGVGVLEQAGPSSASKQGPEVTVWLALTLKQAPQRIWDPQV